MVLSSAAAGPLTRRLFQPSTGIGGYENDEICDTRTFACLAPSRTLNSRGLFLADRWFGGYEDDEFFDWLSVMSSSEWGIWRGWLFVYVSFSLRTLSRTLNSSSLFFRDEYLEVTRTMKSEAREPMSLLFLDCKKIHSRLFLADGVRELYRLRIRLED